MICQPDPRVAELEALAREEGIRLPYPIDYICWLEDHGRMVDLATGEVIYARIVATPTPQRPGCVSLAGRGAKGGRHLARTHLPYTPSTKVEGFGLMGASEPQGKV